MGSNFRRKEILAETFLNSRVEGPAGTQGFLFDADGQPQINGKFRQHSAIYEVTLQNTNGRQVTAVLEARNSEGAARAATDVWRFIQEMT